MEKEKFFKDYIATIINDYLRYGKWNFHPICSMPSNFVQDILDTC